MKAAILTAVALFIACTLTVLVVLGMYVSYNNQEVRLRHQAEAVQVDLQNLLDSTNKKISQTAQVTDKQMDSLKEIIVGNAEARGGSRGSLATSLTEAVPNLDSSVKTFENLQNIIAGARDTYASHQSRLLDIKREHDVLLDSLPSSLFLGGREHLKVQVVTSSRVQESFKTGVDDNDQVFQKKGK